jgi:hypothetical protein
MTHRLIKKWHTRLRNRLLGWLEQDNPAYQQRIFNNLNKLRKVIRKGDVLIVEGRSQMSRVIKLFSSSHWSHVAMYVGDELIQPDHPNRRYYLSVFGHQAQHLLVEAFSGQGVTVTPLYRYRDYNIRICRPYGILPEDLDAVVKDVLQHIGRRYDDRNIVDIAWMMISGFFSSRWKSSRTSCLGSCNEFQVICSGMIAKAFQKVGYPIVPGLTPLPAGQRALPANPYGARLLMRHFSQILPRDFDLSPNFEVIKFNLIGEPFDYRDIWQEKLSLDQ